MKNRFNSHFEIDRNNCVIINGWRIALTGAKYKMIDSEKYPLGVCEDGSINAVRCINLENGRVQKIKCGRFITDQINTYMPGVFNDKEINAICEAFALDFKAYANSHNGEAVTLHIGEDVEDFEKIYSSDSYSCSSFNSCMEDKDYHSFYSDFVDASACWLENAEGEIIARCIRYNQVKNKNNSAVVRLAERQYGESEEAKKMLIDKLIAGDYIDGYKKLGAGCGDVTAFVDVNGEPLKDRFSLWIKLFQFDGYNDTVSYQDSFKYVSGDYAYNDEDMAEDFRLDTTDGRAEEFECDYCEYTEERCRRTVEARYRGRWISVDEDIIDNDFYNIGGRWYHEDDICECAECGDYVILDEDYYSGCYSELTDEEYCCEDCKESAELRYKEENGWIECQLTGALVDPDEWDAVDVFLPCKVWSGANGWRWVMCHFLANRESAEDYNNGELIERVDGSFISPKGANCQVFCN